MWNFFKDSLFTGRSSCYFCRDNYALARPYICSSCYDKLGLVHREASSRMEYIDRLYFASYYEGYIREQIRAFKFDSKSYLYRPLGQILGELIEERGLEDFDYLVPVPQHRRDYRKRGYNQAKLLCDHLAQTRGLGQADLLVKNKYTKKQVDLDREARLHNIKGAFSPLDREKIRTKKILLVDDIVTTGSTLEEVGRCLKEAGAQEVVGLSLSKTRS